MRPDHRQARVDGTDDASVLPASPIAAIADDQGAHVNPTEHNTKSPNARTGIVATLGALLHVKGTRAPSPRSAKGTGARSLTPSALRASTDTSHRQVHPTGSPDCRSPEQKRANSLDKHRQVHSTSADSTLANPIAPARFSTLAALQGEEGRVAPCRSPRSSEGSEKQVDRLLCALWVCPLVPLKGVLGCGRRPRSLVFLPAPLGVCPLVGCK